MHKRQEEVYYDSAKAARTCGGQMQYSCCCPMWVKLTSERVVHSTWDLWHPGFCGGCFSWCCCPVGRTMNTFDSDIIADISAHQTCCQMCMNEGDITIHKMGGGDISAGEASDAGPKDAFVVPNVPYVFGVFDQMTFELSKLDLKHFAARSLGRRMGAETWDRPVAFDGPAEAAHAGEAVFYDSDKAKRNCLGGCFNASCCCPHYYKFTSERMLYSKWDRVDWPCGNCCGLCCCCKMPWGRTLDYFDSDIIVDVGAHQGIMQLCRNEGDLIVHRLGGDASDTNQEFTVSNVPEVWTLFDDLSYDLSKLNLKSYTRNALGQKM